MSADIEGLKKQGFEIEFVAGTTIGLTPGVVNWVLRGGAFLLACYLLLLYLSNLTLWLLCLLRIKEV